MRKFKIGLVVAFLSGFITGCSTMGKMSDVEQFDSSVGECTMMTNVDELIRSYTIAERKKNGINVGYAGASVGTTTDSRMNQVISLQDRLNQRASIIRYAMSSIVIMNNHMCNLESQKLAYATLNTLIKQLADVYKEPLKNTNLNDPRIAQTTVEVQKVETPEVDTVEEVNNLFNKVKDSPLNPFN